jgi:hypothetical protein
MATAAKATPTVDTRLRQCLAHRQIPTVDARLRRTRAHGQIPTINTRLRRTRAHGQTPTVDASPAADTGAGAASPRSAFLSGGLNAVVSSTTLCSGGSVAFRAASASSSLCEGFRA